MEYLVCKFKDESGMMFVTTRKSRETMLSVLQGLGQEIESTVLKSFQNYHDANEYMVKIKAAEKTINDTIT